MFQHTHIGTRDCLATMFGDRLWNDNLELFRYLLISLKFPQTFANRAFSASSFIFAISHGSNPENIFFSSICWKWKMTGKKDYKIIYMDLKVEIIEAEWFFLLTLFPTLVLILGQQLLHEGVDRRWGVLSLFLEHSPKTEQRLTANIAFIIDIILAEEGTSIWIMLALYNNAKN